MLKLVEFVHYEAKSFFRIAWHLRTNIKCSAEVSMKMFLDILCISFDVFDDWLSASRQWKTLRLHFIQRSTSNPRQCLKPLEIRKETFYVFRRTKSTNSWNGLNFRLPWICIFKNISRLPSHFAFFLDFSHLFSDSDNFFRDPWVPLTVFRAATFAVNHFPIKIREQNIVLTQHSAKAHGFFAKRFPEIRTSEPAVVG